MSTSWHLLKLESSHKHPIEVYTDVSVERFFIMQGFNSKEAQKECPQVSNIYRVVSDDPISQTQIALDSAVASLSDLESFFDNLRSHLPIDTSDDWLMQVHLAVHELVTNIIMHAYQWRSGKIYLVGLVYSSELNIDIYDNGIAFICPNLTYKSLDIQEIPESGYGLQILTTVMDTVEYSRSKNDFNHWHLVRRLPMSHREGND